MAPIYIQQGLLDPCGSERPFAAALPGRTGRQLRRPHQSRGPSESLPALTSRKFTCSANKDLRSQEDSQLGRFVKAGKGVSLVTTSSLVYPSNSLAEQHSGLFAIADLDPKTASLVASILAPVLTISILLMICRIPLSWYPNLNVKKLPWAIAVIPTEPILGPTRKAIPPVGGVDIAPIIWVSVLTFVNEILLGPQGILNLLQRQSPL